MNVAIAVFVKTPGVSPLKTRLAATIGQEKAEHFFRLSVSCITRTLTDAVSKNKGKLKINPYWAIAEKESLTNPIWSKFNTLHTGDGDLGDRQSYIYHQLLKTHDVVILIGADAPQLSIAALEQAIDALNQHDYAIGPADDGGYYLLAGKKEIKDEIWSSTPWSDPKTKAVLSKQLDSKPFELAVLTDVDTEDDLKQIRNEMPEELNKEQSALLYWVEQTLT